MYERMFVCVILKNNSRLASYEGGWHTFSLRIFPKGGGGVIGYGECVSADDFIWRIDCIYRVRARQKIIPPALEPAREGLSS